VQHLSGYGAGMAHRRRSLAERLINMRKAAGFNQSTLAAAAGLDRHTVRRIEKGIELNPKLETLQALARACQKDPATLVSAIRKTGPIDAAIDELVRLEAARPLFSPPLSEQELDWAAEQTAIWEMVEPDAEAVADLIRWKRGRKPTKSTK